MRADATGSGRALPAPYDRLHRELAAFLPASRLVVDPLRLLAWGTDASLYRLVPKIVVVIATEAELVRLLRLCASHAAPVTFRAAGTSLSGQAISDSVLVLLTDDWQRCAPSADGSTITLQPNVIGAAANRSLAKFARKIGPDPASIDAAKIGGIAANNASGMCCGTAQNSYRTLAGLRAILADGTIVDTRDPQSRAEFLRRRTGYSPKRWPGSPPRRAPTPRSRSASGTSSGSRTRPATASTRWSTTPIRSTSSPTS